MTWRGNQSLLHVIHLMAQIVIVATLFTFVLLLAERHNHRFDFSPTQQFVLSDAAKKVAQSLDSDVEIIAFYTPDEPGQRRALFDTLELFAKASPRIRYRLVDLNRSPATAQKFGVNNAGSGVVVHGDRVEQIQFVDEEGITAALIRLTRQGERICCFVTGHGEHSPFDNDERQGYSEVAKAMEREGFTLRELNLIPPGGVPQECRVVILAGPTKDFLPGESAALLAYLRQGGQVLLLIDPGAPPSVVAFLESLGARAGNDVVLDERNRLMGTDASMLHVPAFNKSLFRTELETAVFPVARTILPTEEADRSGRVKVLALSSPDSWAYVEGGKLPDRNVRFRREKDQPGPLPVGVYIEVPRAEGGSTVTTPGRLIAFGDSDFATNLALNWRGNKDVFLNSIALLAEDPTLIAVRRKGLPRGSISPIYLTESQDSVVFWITVVVVPGTVATIGIVIATMRRRRGSR
ncbi:MAG: GldG family protein [Candidatus Binatia bacterium]|nr:GldG family protein [Candidatus Binatia bacterium]